MNSLNEKKIIYKKMKSFGKIDYLIEVHKIGKSLNKAIL